MTHALDPTAPGWGHLAARVAELERDARIRAALFVDRPDLIAAAQRLASALGCDECAEAPPVIEPENRWIGHVVERGRRGTGDPDTVDRWGPCPESDFWDELVRRKVLRLVALPEPDYEGQVET